MNTMMKLVMEEVVKMKEPMKEPKITRPVILTLKKKESGKSAYLSLMST